MVILGIDPGIATIGFGLIHAERAGVQLMQYGTITTSAGQPLAQRLVQIDQDISQLLDTFQPDEVAMEELFFSTNITTGISVAHGRGVLLLAAAKRELPIYEYTPIQVKQAVAGYGKADKRQVMLMTQRLLHMNQIPRPDDAADALAIALCHSRAATSLLNTERVYNSQRYSTT